MSIKLKLLVDKKRNKVVFAECQSDFVDVLFSFLTLPLGVVVKLLGKQSDLGCLDNLYESVKNLDAQYLQTGAEVLLSPTSYMMLHCNDVLVKMMKDTVMPPKYIKWDSSPTCSCGRRMHEPTKPEQKDCPLIDGKGMSFLVLDNLFVLQASSDVTFFLLKEHGIEDACMLEEATVDLNKSDEFLLLLKRSFHSETPLTDLFLRDSDTDAAKAKTYNDMSIIKHEKSDVSMEIRQGETSESKGIILKLFESNSTNKLVYMECHNDFADLLFNFLTLSLGRVIFLLGNNSFGLGCINNIYRSVNAFKYNKEEILSILKSEQIQSSISYLTEINPKIQLPGCIGWEKIGRYVRACSTIMITPQMIVKPFSTLHTISLMKDIGASVGDLRQKSVTIGEAEALILLQSCLTSRTLPDFFSEL